ncbi:MAG: entericidin A/B family lipoprotein [Rickettsiales bacterium]|nr:entericidin A/B family lipoprotein [Rickettsiales bacterium]
MTRPIILLSIIAMNLLAACNTVEGVGEDVKAGGHKLEKTAEENKGY